MSSISIRKNSLDPREDFFGKEDILKHIVEIQDDKDIVSFGSTNKLIHNTLKDELQKDILFEINFNTKTEKSFVSFQIKEIKQIKYYDHQTTHEIERHDIIGKCNKFKLFVEDDDLKNIYDCQIILYDKYECRLFYSKNDQKLYYQDDDKENNCIYEIMIGRGRSKKDYHIIYMDDDEKNRF